MKTAFITGAATGIGLGIARKLCREGWRVFAGVLPGQDTSSLWEGSADGPIPIPIDVTDNNRIIEAEMRVREALGGAGLDLLVNCAAIGGINFRPLEQMDEGDFKKFLEVNLWGQTRVTKAFLPLMKLSERPRVVMITSGSVYVTMPLAAPYVVGKEALRAWTRHLRVELAPFGVSVCSVAPGGIDTPMFAATRMDEDLFWKDFPDSYRSSYRKYFRYPGAAVGDQFRPWSTERFADVLYKKVILPKKVRPEYAIGKNMGLLSVLTRLLGPALNEKIFLRVYRR